MLRVACRSRLLAGSTSSLRSGRMRAPHRGVLSHAANKRLDELATRHEELSKKVQAGHDANAMRELHGLDVPRAAGRHRLVGRRTRPPAAEAGARDEAAGRS